VNVSKKKQLDKFLETYRKLESALREKGQQVRDYEETLPESEGCKLKLCRTFRNYLSHEKEGALYIEIAPKLQEFLEEELWKLDGAAIPVKKKMKPLSKGLQLQSTVSDALSHIKSRGVLSAGQTPVFSKESYVGMFSMSCIQKAMENGKYPTAKTSLKQLEPYLDKITPYAAKESDSLETARELSGGHPVLVEKDGKWKGYVQ